MNQLELFTEEMLKGAETVRVRSLTAAARAKLKRSARTVYRRDRGATSVAILDLLWKSAEPMRRAEIAHALEREDTPYFRALLEEMVAGGDVVKTSGRWPGGMLVYYYDANRTRPRPAWSVR